MGHIDEISKDNAALSRLARQSLTLAPMRTRRKRPILEIVRANASSVFTSLQKAIPSSCRSAHVASLYIKPQDQQYHDKKFPEDTESETFRVVLQHTSLAGHALPWLCKETEIRPSGPATRSSRTGLTSTVEKGKVRFADPTSVTSTAIPSNKSIIKGPTAVIPEIHDLCATIVSLQGREQGGCLGYLKVSPPSVRLGLFRPQAPIVDKDSFDMVSLHDLLVRKHNSTSLSIANRQRLAAALALGLLHLYDTPWLTKQWGHREITFFSNGGHILVEHPFISTPLDSMSIQCSPVTYFAPSAAIRNESLFALGILLIELCLHRSFNELLLPADFNADGTKHATTEYCAALRLLETLPGEASVEYVGVTRQCIECKFNQGPASLDNNLFREALYDNVVAVLQDEASRFAGA
jgi:hypothetical protein